MSKPLTKYEYRTAVVWLTLIGVFVVGGALWTADEWANAGPTKVVYSD